MTEVKICGIGSLEDAMAACRFGADALGFIFYRGSPRCISPENARRIILHLPETVAKVGVFVNEEWPVVQRVFRSCSLDFIQLHGDETLESCRGLDPSLLIRAVRPEKMEDLEGLERWAPSPFLVDSGDPGRYGGTGRLSDWGLAREMAGRYPLILAGGLDPRNVTAAIHEVSPAAVDVGSGVEESVGKKDHEKIQAFIEAVRAAGGGTGRGIFRK